METTDSKFGAPITTVYAGALGLLCVALSMRTVILRRTARIYYGDGGNALMLAISRGHANFAEHATLGIVLCGLAELSGRSPAPLVHCAGGSMLAGRLMHAHSTGVTIQEMGRSSVRVVCRVAGMGLTYASFVVSSAACLGAPPIAQHLLFCLTVASIVLARPRPSRKKPVTAAGDSPAAAAS